MGSLGNDFFEDFCIIFLKVIVWIDVIDFKVGFFIFFKCYMVNGCCFLLMYGFYCWLFFIFWEVFVVSCNYLFCNFSVFIFMILCDYKVIFLSWKNRFLYIGKCGKGKEWREKGCLDGELEEICKRVRCFLIGCFFWCGMWIGWLEFWFVLMEYWLV